MTEVPALQPPRGLAPREAEFRPPRRPPSPEGSGAASEVAGSPTRTAPVPDPRRFEAEIQAFEAEDRRGPPPRGAIVFTGSSTIAMWRPTLAADFAPLTVVPRGFGGSIMNEALFYEDRIVIPYAPRAVVLYEGDNDLAMGIGPDAILDGFRAFAAKLDARLPRARLYVLSVRPSPSRWALWPTAQALNAELARMCAADPRRRYVDVASAMLGAGGTLRPDLYLQDQLHMSPAGYALWRSILRPLLLEAERGAAGAPNSQGGPRSPSAGKSRSGAQPASARARRSRATSRNPSGIVRLRPQGAA